MAMIKISGRLLFLAALLLMVGACSEAPVAEDGEVTEAPIAAPVVWGDLQIPASPGSLAPGLLTVGDRVIASWLDEDEGGHTLRFGTVGSAGISEARVGGSGGDLFANWADRPGLHQAGDGSLLAHWLKQLGDETYAYGVELRSVEDSGPAPVWLHDDTSPTEHGFVTSVSTDDGLRFFWLDGRAMAQDGPMGLRTTRLADAQPEPSVLLDDRVCECCPTGAAVASTGPIVVYRDRSDEEIRDIYFVRQVEGEWQEPQAVAHDGWEINGCPVNGPAIAADGEDVVVVWFTAAQKQARVQWAVSRDAGATFSAPVVIDDVRPVGRVDVALHDGEIFASWLGRAEGKGEIRLARGQIGTPDDFGIEALVSSDVGRSAGYPRIALQGDALLLTWVGQVPANEGADETDPQDQVRLRRIAL